MSNPSNDWLEELNAIDGITIHRNRHLYHHTPLRVGGPTDAWVRCTSIAGLKEVMKSVRKVPWRIHWPFDDWLVKNGGLSGMVIRLEGVFEQWSVSEEYLELGSSVLWSSLQSIVPVQSSKELHSWSGSVGSALVSEQASSLFSGFELEVEWIQGRHKRRQFFDKQTPLELPNKAIPTCLRIHSVRSPRKIKPILNGQIFSLSKQQSLPETLSELSLNGVRLRDWKVSSSHPDFVVHRGTGNIEDLQLLLKALNQRLKPARNIKLSFRKAPFGRS